MITPEEAKCPECGEWSRVAQTGPYVVPVDEDENGDIVTGIVYGPCSWTDEDGDANTGPAGCPKCGAIVLIESECDFRKAGEAPIGENGLCTICSREVCEHTIGSEATP